MDNVNRMDANPWKSGTRYDVFLIITFLLLLGVGALAVFNTLWIHEGHKDIKELTVNHITVDGKGIFGNYTGLEVASVSADTSTVNLANNTVTSLILTSDTVTNLNLPKAKKTDRVVLTLGGHVGLSIGILNFTCSPGDVFAEGTVAPSVNSSNQLIYIKSSLGDRNMKYRVDFGGEFNLMSKGSVIEFISDKDDEWQIYFNVVPQSIENTTVGAIEFS